MENRKIIELTIEEFFSEFNKRMKNDNESNDEEFLTRKIACEKFKISLPTLDLLIKNGMIKKYDFGGRKKLIKYSELNNALKSN